MREPTKIINRTIDQKKNYLIRLEIGFICSLLILIGLVRIEIRPSESGLEIVSQVQETFEVKDIIQTKQKTYAPPPPKPMVPVEVPNDEIIENEIIDISADLDLDEYMELPPPPPDPGMDEQEEETEEIFIVVEQQPELIGGYTTFQKTINYPQLALMAGIEGRVVVQFVVNKKGEVEDAFVVRGIGGGCDEEALRAVKAAKFKPGMQRGRPVKVRYSLPVTFKLSEEKVNF